MQSIKQLDNQLRESKSIAIIGHQSPDVDDLASIVATKKIVEINFPGKEIDIYAETNNINEMFIPIIEGENVNPNNEDTIYDLVICLDSPNTERLGKYGKIFSNAKDSICIDHHDNSEKFARNNFVYKCSSTCELVYILFTALKAEISNECLKLIYAGIITDTANLSQGTIKISTYKTITDIATKLNDIHSLEAIKDLYMKSNTKSNAKLLEKALHSMAFYLQDRVAIMKITKQDLLETESTQDDTVGIVNNAINIKGVDIAIILIKQEDESYYVSLRSKTGINVSDIATFMGGGGHETVAAFTYNGKLTELKPIIMEQCTKAMISMPSDSDNGNPFDD